MSAYRFRTKDKVRVKDTGEEGVVVGYTLLPNRIQVSDTFDIWFTSEPDPDKAIRSYKMEQLELINFDDWDFKTPPMGTPIIQVRPPCPACGAESKRNYEGYPWCHECQATHPFLKPKIS